MNTLRGRNPLAYLASGLACMLLAAGCSTATTGKHADPSPVADRVSRHSAKASLPGAAAPKPRLAKPYVAPPFRHPLPGMPPVVGNDVYGATRAGMVSPEIAGDPAYVYVPDSKGSTVTVISQRTRKVVRVIRTGYLTQHVTPSYDLRHLYADSSAADEFVVINPHTGRKVRSIPVPRPYNLYFTPDGKQAVVMVEQHDIIRFSDPRTFRRRADVSRPGCLGPNHADFSGNGRFMVVTCEFSGTLLKIGTVGHHVLGELHFGSMSMPQDVRISPDARTFYVADMGTDVVRLIDAASFRQVGEIHMPADPHGLYPTGRLASAKGFRVLETRREQP